MFNQTQDKPSEHIDDPQANTEAPVLSEGYGERSRETQKAPQQKESISTQHTKSNSNERRVVSAMLTPSMNLNINTRTGGPQVHIAPTITHDMFGDAFKGQEDGPTVGGVSSKYDGAASAPFVISNEEQ